MCQLNDRALQPPCQCLPFQPSEMGDTNVYFIRPVAPAHRSEPNELQNVHEIQQRVYIAKILNANGPTFYLFIYLFA